MARREWAQILGEMVHWRFSTGDETATYPELDAAPAGPGVVYIEVTGLSPMPCEHWTYDDGEGTFAAPAAPSLEERWARFRERRLDALFRSDHTEGTRWRARESAPRVEAADGWRDDLLDAPETFGTPESAAVVLDDKPAFLP